MFSYPIGLKAEKRPIYGYATKSKFGWTADYLDPDTKYDSVSMYGQIRVKLKKNLSNLQEFTNSNKFLTLISEILN